MSRARKALQCFRYPLDEESHAAGEAVRYVAVVDDIFAERSYSTMHEVERVAQILGICAERKGLGMC